MKKNIVILLISCLLLQLNGCYTPKLVSNEELLITQGTPGIVVRTNEQVEYAFNEGTYIIDSDSIYGACFLILENCIHIPLLLIYIFLII